MRPAETSREPEAEAEAAEAKRREQELARADATVRIGARAVRRIERKWARQHARGAKPW